MLRATDQPELLDGPLDHAVLEGNLRDMARANRWLGGVAISRRALIALITGRHAYPRVGRHDWRERTIRLLDVGTGSADIPEALVHWTAQRGINVDVEAVDERHEVLDVAYERIGDRSGLRLDHTAPDRLAYPDGTFDVTHASLVLHHLEPPAATRFLGELARTSLVGVIVNDLDRTRRGLTGAWLLSRLATRNTYTRNDAPLSVRRAYRPEEVAQMATEAGLIEVARIAGPFRHRYAMAFVHATPAPVEAAASPPLAGGMPTDAKPKRRRFRKEQPPGSMEPGTV